MVYILAILGVVIILISKLFHEGIEIFSTAIILSIVFIGKPNASSSEIEIWIRKKFKTGIWVYAFACIITWIVMYAEIIK